MRNLLAILLCAICATPAYAEEMPEFHLLIRAGRFIPEVVEVPANTRFRLRIKNEGPYLALRNAPFEIVRDLVVMVAALTIERSSLPAFGWLWRNRSRVLAHRKAIQQRRRTPDSELARWFR